MRLPNRIFYKISLINNSQTATAKSISASISSTDPNVTSITGSPQVFGSIGPGQIVQSSDNVGFVFSSMSPSFTVPIHLKISSEGYVFWEDSSEMVVGIEDVNSVVAMDYSLHQNYPNPFNPTTMIGYQLPIGQEVQLTVHDILGREIITLVNSQMPAGEHQVTWDARDIPSGIYYYKIQAGDYTEVRKMILMK
jgi:hypothetical protein